MSEFKIRKLTDRSGTGAPNFTYGFNINGSDSGLVGFAHTEGSTEPSSPSNGDTWWDTGNDKYYVYVNDAFKEYSIPAAGITWGGDRGLFSGGETSSARVNTIDYVDLTSAGNATDFGDLTVGRSSISSTSSTSRSVFILGWDGTNSRNEMDYVSPATTGNATDFGDYVFAGSASNSGVISNNTTGIYGGAYSAAVYNRVNNISKITIATTGNATDFGDLSNGRSDLAAGTDDTRGVFMGGRDATTSAAINTIEYITIASDGNATDFGDLITAVRKNIGTSDATYSFSFGGIGDYTAIEYITTQTTGNATDFGNLSINILDGGACCNGTTAVLVGYQSGTGYVDTIQQITTATAGDATDFGDLTQARSSVGSASGAAS